MKLHSFSVYLTVLAPMKVTSTILSSETDNDLVISNDRLSAIVAKGSGVMVSLHLDGQNLLGTLSGSTGRGPYLGKK